MFHKIWDMRNNKTMCWLNLTLPKHASKETTHFKVSQKSKHMKNPHNLEKAKTYPRDNPWFQPQTLSFCFLKFVLFCFSSVFGLLQLSSSKMEKLEFVWSFLEGQMAKPKNRFFLLLLNIANKHTKHKNTCVCAFLL